MITTGVHYKGPLPRQAGVGRLNSPLFRYERGAEVQSKSV